MKKLLFVILVLVTLISSVSAGVFDIPSGFLGGFIGTNPYGEGKGFRAGIDFGTSQAWVTNKEAAAEGKMRTGVGIDSRFELGFIFEDANSSAEDFSAMDGLLFFGPCVSLEFGRSSVISLTFGLGPSLSLVFGNLSSSSGDDFNTIIGVGANVSAYFLLGGMFGFSIGAYINENIVPVFSGSEISHIPSIDGHVGVGFRW